ncbi:MAG: LamG domain-containing protein [Bacteroidetes bacterium]|nr:LamG domain-containing protein [Bacteroidota bacterium]
MLAAFLGCLALAGPGARAQSGYALRFNGSNGVNMGDPATNVFELVGDVTLEAWVRVDDTPPAALGGTCFTILGKDLGPGNNQHKWFWGLQNGRLAYHINGPGYGNGYWVYSNAFPLSLGRWYHYALTKQGDNYTFYVNGEAVGTAAMAAATYDVPASFTTGYSEPCCNMQGYIDEVRVWQQVHSVQHLRHKMCEKLAGTEPGLAAYYRMDEGVNGTCLPSGDVCDTSGNGYHGIKF